MGDIEAADSKGSAGAPETDRITAEMIEAGAAEVCAVLHGERIMSDSLALLVSEKVIRAAELKRPGKNR